MRRQLAVTFTSITCPQIFGVMWPIGMSAPRIPALATRMSRRFQRSLIAAPRRSIAS